MLIDNLKQIRYRIRAAAQRANRAADSVALVAVTKYAPLSSVAELLQSGLVAEVGESRVQDVEKKKAALGAAAAGVRWRMIGHLQTNKAKKAAFLFDSIDSIDAEETAEALDASLRGSNRVLSVLVQVRLSDRATQFGAAPDELPALLQSLAKYANLKVEGLMAIAPQVERAEDARPSFRKLRELRDRHLPAGKLSMGMSRDFEIAVEEGADLVRIGSQIFSQQSPASLEAPA